MGLFNFLRPAPAATPDFAAVPVKAVTGAGAFAMTYDTPISQGRMDNARGMAKAQALSHANPWIDKAERLICGRLSAMPWHLEDADDVSVDDESPEAMRRIRDLLERPSPISKPDATWRDLIHITARHMGVCNVGAWYLDALDGYGIPSEILYLNPARLTPYERNGQLLKWILDADGNNAVGRPTVLELDEVILFTLIPPDTGYFGQGLVESAETKATLSKYADRFTTQTFATGGRRGSWVSPKEGRMPDDVFDALVAGLKTIANSPDATKRNIVSKGAIDITPQASTPEDLQASEIMAMTRDDILVLWGVDVADAGIPGASGLSSGQMRAEARQSTYENAIEPRLDVIEEKIQLRLLDRWKKAGIVLEFEFERPEFEDDTPAFERAAKAVQLPLRNWERREILGLDPFGDPVLDNAVWLPAGISEAYLAPDENGVIPAAPEPPPVAVPVVPPMLTDGEGSPDMPPMPAKASPLGRTRATVDRRVTPRMRRSVAEVLQAQRDEVVRLVREKAGHLMSKPGDARAVWNDAKWNKALADALRPHAEAIADVVATETKQAIGHLNPAKADPPAFLDTVRDVVWKRGANRVTGINAHSRDSVVEAIRRVVTESALRVDPDTGEPAALSIPEVADRLTDAVGALVAWDPARAETIARTETMFAYNDAALASYGEYGVDQVEAIDGDEDQECADRNGQVFSLEEAASIVDHPNGTLDWLPVL